MVVIEKYFSHVGVFLGRLYSSTYKMKVLNVAEKNDAAKTIAGFMSSNINRREGFSKFNKIYEFEHALFGQKCDMIMTSVSGHLLGYEFVGSYKGWKSCNPLALFDAPLTKQCLSGYENIKRTLEREARKCSVIIIWTDCDREGEAIGFEIIEVCKAVKSNIRVYRAKFSEITFQSVRRALQNLSSPDKKVNDAVEVRQELDLRIGAAFTRFQTLRLKQVFPESLRESLISYGSCQFPTLGFVVERYKAIQSFIPESFWKIKVIHEKNDLCVEFSWKRVRLFDELACQCFYDLCMENPLATVQSVTSKPKSRWRPLPLDTVELEKVGSRKLRINAKEIMKIAEKLYTQGFISYPRTETNIFPKEINLANLIGMQTADPAWGEFASWVLQDGPTPRNGTKSDMAHPPIHPIKYTSNLTGNEQKIYEFVVRRFLACCSKDAEGQETLVEINIADELFVASGLMIIAKNFLEVYPYEKWNAKEIHVYQFGETFTPKIEIVGGTTSPPKLLTEADLIALMEKHGIGTDATHADHIETIKSRLYVGLESEKFFVPGHLGMGLVEGYDKMGYPMSKPNLRAELEADLVKICEGRKRPEAVLREQVAKYKAVFEVALQQAAKIDEALAVYLQEEPCPAPTNYENNSEMMSPVFKCPSCGSDMVLRSKRDGHGKYISCMSYPQCKTVVWFPSIVEDVMATEVTCAQCGPNYKKLKFKFRSGALPPYYIPEDSACIGGCDRDLLDILDIRLETVQSNTNNSARSTNSSFSSGLSTSRVSSGSYLESTADMSTFDTNGNQSLNHSRNSNRGGRGRTEHQHNGQRSITDVFQLSRTTSDSMVSSRIASTQQRVESNSADVVMCNCNQSAKLLTVKKEGPNKGRLFYKCSNQSQCSFFQWADSLTAPTSSRSDWNSGHTRDQSNDSATGSNFLGAYRGASSLGVNQFSNSERTCDRASNASTTFTHNVTQSFSSPENTIVCGCNVSAVRLTVRKDGPNKGRQFYKCGNNQGYPCNFFFWVDNSPNENPNQSMSINSVNSWEQPSGPTSRSTDPDEPTTGDVRCRCGGPARRWIVQKDGPNKGRPFFSCPKILEKCQFFMWADEGASQNSASTWRNNEDHVGNREFNSYGKKKRKCGHCRQEGHTKKTCPHH